MPSVLRVSCRHGVAMNSKRTQISTTLSDLAVIPLNGIDDHVPEDTQDTDQVEAVVDMRNDLGVFDQAPDAEALPLKSQQGKKRIRQRLFVR